MAKKFLNIVALALVVCALTSLCACSERAKQNPIPTDLTDKTVKSNGGLAVRYGKYLYFINGFAGETALNTFGDVTRGAVCRAEIGADGAPDIKTTKIIAPKNAFSKENSGFRTLPGGIFVAGDNLFYNTTSVDKNSKREYKTSEGVLARTSLDGSTTETVTELEGNDISLYAGDNSAYLAYLYDKYLYAVNAKTMKITKLSLNNGKPPKAKPKKKDKRAGQDTVTGCKFGGDYVVYTLYNRKNESHYSEDVIVWAFSLKDGTHKKLLGSADYDPSGKTLYVTTLSSVVPLDAGGFALYYSRKGNDSDSNDGYYCREFKSDLTFAPGGEKMLSLKADNCEYSSFYRLTSGHVLATGKDCLDVFMPDGARATDAEHPDGIRISVGKDRTVADICEDADSVVAHYKKDGKPYSIRLLAKKADGTPDLTTAYDGEARLLFDGKIDENFPKGEIVDGILYYFDKDMANNIFYFRIPDEKTQAGSDSGKKDPSEKKGKLLGLLSDKDMLDLISDPPKDSDDD